MITILEHGCYKLVETRRGTKLLYLGHNKFAWIVVPRIGSLLIFTRRFHRARDVVASGTYYLYDIDEEPHLSDQFHLELEVGRDSWQGYLLPTGLPTPLNPRKLFIPTSEVVTSSSQSIAAKDRVVG